jgi:hypothetical protein
LKSNDRGFATASCSGNTTKHATVYRYPGNKNITLHDLTVFGTTEFSKNEYEEKMGLHKYDYFLIFVRNIEENDTELDVQYSFLQHFIFTIDYTICEFSQ